VAAVDVHGRKALAQSRPIRNAKMRRRMVKTRAEADDC
jgi:hypothetical protein